MLRTSTRKDTNRKTGPVKRDYNYMESMGLKEEDVLDRTKWNLE